MTALYLFWFASVAGAALFFVAGRMSTARSKDGQDAAQPVATSSVQDAGAAGQLEELLADRAQLALRQNELQQAQAELEQARRERASAEEKLAAISSLGDELDARSRSQRRAVSEAKVELGEMRTELERRTHELATERQQMNALRARADEVESLRGDKMVLRAEAGELRRTIDELQSTRDELRELRAREFASSSTTNLPVAPVQAPNSNTMGGALQGVIDDLAEAQGAIGVVLADGAGFPVVAFGTQSTALAGYASLVCEVAVRAGALLPIGAPDHVTVIDRNGSTISVWPFQRDHRWLSIVILNAGDAGDPAAVRGAVAAVLDVLSKISDAAA